MKRHALCCDEEKSEGAARLEGLNKGGIDV